MVERHVKTLPYENRAGKFVSSDLMVELIREAVSKHYYVGITKLNVNFGKKTGRSMPDDHGNRRDVTAVTIIFNKNGFPITAYPDDAKTNSRTGKPVSMDFS